MTASTATPVSISVKLIWLWEVQCRAKHRNTDSVRSVLDHMRIEGLCNIPETIAERLAVGKRIRRALRDGGSPALSLVQACYEAQMFGATPFEVLSALNKLVPR